MTQRCAVSICHTLCVSHLHRRLSAQSSRGMQDKFPGVFRSGLACHQRGLTPSGAYHARDLCAGDQEEASASWYPSRSWDSRKCSYRSEYHWKTRQCQNTVHETRYVACSRTNCSVHFSLSRAHLRHSVPVLPGLSNNIRWYVRRKIECFGRLGLQILTRVLQSEYW